MVDPGLDLPGCTLLFHLSKHRWAPLCRLSPVSLLNTKLKSAKFRWLKWCFCYESSGQKMQTLWVTQPSYFLQYPTLSQVFFILSSQTRWRSLVADSWITAGRWGHTPLLKGSFQTRNYQTYVSEGISRAQCEQSRRHLGRELQTAK